MRSTASTGRVPATVLRAFCVAVILFLVAPIAAIVPLSFNAEPFFTYPMPGFSLQWYREFLDSAVWQLALRNSLIVAFFATLLSTALGTLAALGLSRRDCPWRASIMAVLISPMIIPVIVSAVGIYYCFARVGLVNTLTGIVIAHTALGAPFVVITVMATLSSFDHNLMRAAASLGASPVRAFFKVMLPVIAPGVASGALFAFITSFDEVVLSIFLAGPTVKTLPVRIWEEIRLAYTPVVAVGATVMLLLALCAASANRLLHRK